MTSTLDALPVSGFCPIFSCYMVVSKNGETPIRTPKNYNPKYRDPQKGTPNLGNPPYIPNRLGHAGSKQGSGFGVNHGLAMSLENSPSPRLTWKALRVRV